MNVTIEAQRRAVLGALAQLGKGWHTRAALAKALGKKSLNAGEITMLESLVELGMVGRDTVNPRAGLVAFVYTLKSAK